MQGDWSYQYESDTDTSVKSSSSAIREDTGHPKISSFEPIVLKEMVGHFGNKSFMRHNAQVF